MEIQIWIYILCQQALSLAQQETTSYLLNAGMAFYSQQFYLLRLEFFQPTECHDLRNSLAVILPLYMQLTLTIEPSLTHSLIHLLTTLQILIEILRPAVAHLHY
jgi:hypothetical protein